MESLNQPFQPVQSGAQTSRCSRLGIDPRWVSVNQEEGERWLKQYTDNKYPPEALGQNLYMNIDFMEVILLGHYVFEHIPQVQELAQRLVDAAEHYFFGEWRQTIPYYPSHVKERGYWARGGGDWVRGLRGAIAWGSAIGRWDSLVRLSTFPSESSTDCGTLSSWQPWYRTLCLYLREEPGPVFQQRLQGLLSSSRTKDRLLAQILDALVRRDAAALGERFEAWMKHYRRSLWPRPDFDFKLAIDGTILVHLAARLQLPLEYDPKWRDYLILLQE